MSQQNLVCDFSKRKKTIPFHIKDWAKCTQGLQLATQFITTVQIFRKTSFLYKPRCSILPLK